VAGPSEVAYWGQLKPLFEAHGLPMPVVYPRLRALLTNPKLHTSLRTHGLDIADLQLPEQNLIERALEQTGDRQAFDLVNTAENDLTETLDRLNRNLAAHSPVGASMANRLAQNLGKGIERIKRTVAYEDTQRVQATRQQVQRILTALQPDKTPQERLYTIFSFVFEHGWQLVPRLIETLDITSFELNEVEL